MVQPLHQCPVRRPGGCSWLDNLRANVGDLSICGDKTQEPPDSTLEYEL